MDSTSVSGRPWLRRLVRFRRLPLALFVSATAFVLTIAVVATASGAGGVATACISDDMASDQEGGFRPVVTGPETETVQRTTGSTRQVILWEGSKLVCPEESVQPCDLTYSKEERKSTRKAINLVGGLGATGGAIPVPFPIISASGTIKDETITVVWSESLVAHADPGQTATPILAVDYQVWRGNFVGAYHYEGEQDGCHLYSLSPNEEFGEWSGEIATKEYATFVYS